MEAGRTADAILLGLANPGGLGACLTLRDVAGDDEPWHFTLGAGHGHRARIPIYAARYHYVLSGPAGAQWTFAGDTDDAGLSALLAPGPSRDTIALRLANGGARPVQLGAVMRAPYADGGMGERTGTIPAGATDAWIWTVARSDGWFDLAVGVVGGAWRRGLAGRFDTGLPTRTDPGIASALPA